MAESLQIPTFYVMGESPYGAYIPKSETEN